MKEYNHSNKIKNNTLIDYVIKFQLTEIIYFKNMKYDSFAYD